MNFYSCFVLLLSRMSLECLGKPINWFCQWSHHSLIRSYVTQMLLRHRYHFIRWRFWSILNKGLKMTFVFPHFRTKIDSPSIEMAVSLACVSILLTLFRRLVSWGNVRASIFSEIQYTFITRSTPCEKLLSVWDFSPCLSSSTNTTVTFVGPFYVASPSTDVNRNWSILY